MLSALRRHAAAPGKRVELFTDTIETLREQDARRAFDEFTIADGMPTTVAQVAAE
jgi:hypothetical protein